LAIIATWRRIWNEVPGFLGVVYAAVFALLLKLFKVQKPQFLLDLARGLLGRSS
jgi:hypothetical protein